ncbi:MAG TPA: GtrA family protein [Verrucomicrobiae bacterium]|nr:GtrA family protein [Verrucomicrobiae bacterium]
MRRVSALLLAKPGFRYLFIGGTVYLFELAVIVLAQQAYHTSALWAVAIAYCLGTTVSFFLQKLVTFGDTRFHHRILIPQMIATALLVLWNFLFSLLVTRVLQHHAPAVVTRTVALAITTIWNFYLYKTRIFKHSEEEVFG